MPRRDLLLLLFVPTACADAAADASYKGEPLDRIQGVVAVEAALPDFDAGELRVTLWWSTGGGGALPPERDVAPTGELPAEFVLDLFEAPPAERLEALADSTGKLALGQIVVYLDEDGDHAWNAEVEPVYGLAGEMVVAFTPDGFAGPLVGSLAAGFHHLAPTPCSAKSPLRFAGPATDETRINIYPKPLGADIKESLFVLACDLAPPPECIDLEAIRRACHADPTGPDCERCGDGIFPSGATPEECEAWRQQCVAKYRADECGNEAKACINGDDTSDPACTDKPCICANGYAECIAAGLPVDVCETKRDNCFAQ